MTYIGNQQKRSTRWELHIYEPKITTSKYLTDTHKKTSSIATQGRRIFSNFYMYHTVPPRTQISIPASPPISRPICSYSSSLTHHQTSTILSPYLDCPHALALPVAKHPTSITMIPFSLSALLYTRPPAHYTPLPALTRAYLTAIFDHLSLCGKLQPSSK